MYLRFHGFRDYPFSITPDPAFLYLSVHHREALGHLLYGTGEHGGFVQLTGEVGTGKTTLIRALLEQDTPELDVALCLNPRLTVEEFVAGICDELGVTRPDLPAPTLKTLVDALNAHLLESHAAGRRTVLIVDEAQNLDREVLEQLRLLTNLETPTHKLLRIILVGQPELETMLRRPDLRQLAQRITARYHLRALGRRETAAYIRHRLDVAGGPPDLFTAGACRAVHARSGGIPRLINTICERALMGGYSRGCRRIGASMVRRAAREALPRPAGVPRHGWLAPAAVLLAAVGVAFGLHHGVDRLPAAGFGEADPPPAEQAAPETAAAAADPGAVPDAGSEAVAIAVSDNAPDELPLPADDADMGQLLRLWGVFGESVRASCRQLAVGDLRCADLSGDFGDLERYNRPALLALETGAGLRWVLLSSLDATHATLIFGDGTRRLPRARLGELWTGRFRIVWRQPVATRLVGPGAVGSAVVWVRQRLAQAEGVDTEQRVSRPSPIYDRALQAKIRAFQRRNGLTQDGIVGPRTMVLLNNVAPESGTPFLSLPESG